MKYLIPDIEIIIMEEGCNILCQSVPGLGNNPDEEGNDMGNMDDLL